MTCVLALLVGGLTACGGGTATEARTALSGLSKLGERATRSAEDIAREQEILRSIPKREFSTEDWALRATLLESSDRWLAEGVVAEVDDAIRTQTGSLETDARVIATSSAQTSDQAFVKDFSEVTQELVEGAACDAVLDQVAPEDKPAEPGKGSAWEDAAQEAYDKLTARRWTGASFVDLVNWTYYAQAVAQDGLRLANALLEDPDKYVQFASAPPVQRAVALYLRACYSPPKPFTPNR